MTLQNPAVYQAQTRASACRQTRRSHPVGQGFTLLELLVVMVIIGLLAAYVGPRYFAQLGKSEQGAAKAQIEAFAKALDAYRLDTGYYPTTDLGLNALVIKPGSDARWQGPYLQKAIPLDPWGRAYIYRNPGATSDFDVLSYGKDGQAGGDGDNADVSFR
jgi:general secretion pathway protein G